MSLELKPSFQTKNMPFSSRGYLHMVDPAPFSRGRFLVAFLFLLQACACHTAFAQDAGAPATPGGLSNYQNAPVSTILDLYEGLSGKHLIRDANLTAVPPVSVNATGLTKEEELRLIESTLLLNGVAIVPVDDKTVKVITVGTNKNPRSEGPKLYANAADLPTDDEIVSYYMPLNYISPQEAQGIFSLDAPTHLYGAYVPVPTAQAIVLTENTGVIRELIALKELIDVPPATVTTEFIQLNRADAEKVADTINKMLGNSAAGTPGAPSGAPGGVIVPPGLGNTSPLSNEHNLISGTALVLPETRSNRIIITTRPVNIPFLERMISQLDEPDTFLQPVRRPLKYVLAQDILPALEAALAQGKEEEDQVQKDQSAAHTNSGQTGGAPQQQQQQQASSVEGGSGGGSGSVSAITPQLQSPAENNVPTVVSIGKTRLMADNRSNSIIVFGSADVVTRVMDMIDQLDRKPLQVYLGTVIGQLTVSEGLEFGIDILQKFQRVGQGGLSSSLVTPTTSTTGAASVPEPASLTSALGFPLPTGLTLYGAIGSTLDAYVRALASTDRFKVISRPSVYTTNNKLAVIASGSQVPVPSSITSGFTGGTTTNDLATTASVQYENVLLQLDIIPLINANHEVTLKIRQTNNSLGANNVISGNNVPTILTQEINTEVTVPDKSTVVIGGLISDTTTRDTSGVPFLSDIPVLGYLFKDTKKSKERDELIIMIQPTVVETDADQIAVNEAEKQRTILGREAVDAAAGTTSGAPQSAALGLEPMSDSELNIRRTNVTTISNTATGASTTVTKTTTTHVPAPNSGPSTSIVPALSTPAPDVSNGKMPPYNGAPVPPPTTSQ
jgi:general secretion pathway protein D